MTVSERQRLLARLSEGCDALDMSLSDEQLAQLVEFLFQLQRWNKTYNLTAIRDLDDMLAHHLLDSLAVIPALTTRVSPHQSARVMDVGSGGGLPGVVLAAVMPNWQVICVDAVEKKMAFVRQMAGVLKLPNLSACHTRVEKLEAAGCDVVISRAFASLQDFAALAGRHVKQGGTLAAMKGKRPDDELQAIQATSGWCVSELVSVQVPGLQADRCLVLLHRE